MQETTNLHLKKYQNTDAVNLLTGYNASMDTLDTTIKQAQDNIAALETGAFVPDPTNDDTFDVSSLANAKITSNGIVYVPQTSNGGA